jgi:hypothetical protein
LGGGVAFANLLLLRLDLLLPAAGLLEPCRVPPRQAGNFHLLAQMKVTKAKGLNATPFIFTVAIGTAVRRALLDARHGNHVGSAW